MAINLTQNEQNCSFPDELWVWKRCKGVGRKHRGQRNRGVGWMVCEDAEQLICAAAMPIHTPEDYRQNRASGVAITRSFVARR